MAADRAQRRRCLRSLTLGFLLLSCGLPTGCARPVPGQDGVTEEDLERLRADFEAWQARRKAAEERDRILRDATDAARRVHP